MVVISVHSLVFAFTTSSCQLTQDYLLSVLLGLPSRLQEQKPWTVQRGSWQPECLITLCEAREKAPGMMRKLPQFLDSFLSGPAGLPA